MILSNSYEYRLIDGEVTYLIGLIPEDNIITKNYLTLGRTLMEPEIEIKSSQGDTNNIKLVKIKSDFIATTTFCGINFGVKVSPMKNDKRKFSIYIRKLS